MIPTLPGSEHSRRILDAVRVTLDMHRGDPVSQATLALEVRVLCGLDEMAETSLRRRAKQAVRELRRQGVPVVSTSYGPQAGYRLGTPREVRAYLVTLIREQAATLAAFDQAAAMRVQLALDLGAA